MLLHLPDWPVSQALALLKDQTLSCLFITLILFSTWLYYLLGLLWERQLQTVVLSICFLPPRADASTRAAFPRCPTAWSSQLPRGRERCLNKAWLLSVVRRAGWGLKRRQCQATPRAALPQAGQGYSFLSGSSENRGHSCLCSFSLRLFLGSIPVQYLGLVRSRDFIRQCCSRSWGLRSHPGPKSVPRPTPRQGNHRQKRSLKDYSTFEIKRGRGGVPTPSPGLSTILSPGH